MGHICEGKMGFLDEIIYQESPSSRGGGKEGVGVGGLVFQIFPFLHSCTHVYNLESKNVQKDEIIFTKRKTDNCSVV